MQRVSEQLLFVITEEGNILYHETEYIYTEESSEENFYLKLIDRNGNLIKDNSVTYVLYGFHIFKVRFDFVKHLVSSITCLIYIKFLHRVQTNTS